MKKIFSFVIAAVIVLAFGTTAFADDGAGIHMESSRNGDKSTVSVVISGKTNPEMIQFCMNYDPEKMECLGTSAGGILEGNSNPLINVKDGKIFFVWDSLDSIKEDGVLLTVEFKSIDSAYDADVSIEGGKNLIIAGSDFKNIAPEEVKSVTVFEGTKPSQEVVITPSGGSSQNKEESSVPDIKEPEKEDEPKEEKPAEESKPEKENTPEENKEPEEVPKEPPQESEDSKSEEPLEESETVPNEIEVITNNRKEKSGAPIWLIIMIPIGAAVAGTVLILLKHRK